MKTQCPSCDKYFYGQQCSCGHSIEPRIGQDQQLSLNGRIPLEFNFRGYKRILNVFPCSRPGCRMPGTISHSIPTGNDKDPCAKLKYYCTEHYNA